MTRYEVELFEPGGDIVMSAVCPWAFQCDRIAQRHAKELRGVWYTIYRIRGRSRKVVREMRFHESCVRNRADFWADVTHESKMCLRPDERAVERARMHRNPPSGDSNVQPPPEPITGR